MVDAKLSLTTACGAKCATCPAWHREPKNMPLDMFMDIWIKLNDSPMVGRILINGTGDVTAIDGWRDYFDAAELYKKKYVTMTTNAANLDYIPPVLDEIIISFNGGTRETYRKTTGLDFDTVVAKIRGQYDDISKLSNAEIHCLIWKANEGDEQAFSDLWEDFPGRRRISYKAENQGGSGFGVIDDGPRLPCDYLQSIVIEWDGGVSMCTHDWERTETFGNLSTDDVLDVVYNKRRGEKVKEHLRGVYTGVCETCNYNTPVFGKVVYL